MSQDLVGRTIADGRYEIVRQIGQGGMGAVYLARQVAMDRMVALKLIRADMVKSPEAAARFNREMRLTAKIEHPNTIRVYDFGFFEGQLFLTMEFVSGLTLSEVMVRDGRLPLDRIIEIMAQVARALQAAHAAGVVHRDLKPDNIMLVEQYGERDIVKVLDFGVAKSLEDDQPRVTSTGALVGTPVYISPEQAMGHKVDPRSDLYSLGIIMYEMASGRAPFLADSLTALLIAHATTPPPPLGQVAPEVHPGLAALVDELLAKDPAARPATAKDVEIRLRALKGGVGPMPQRPPPGRGGPPGRRKSRWPLIGGILGVLAVGGGVVVAVTSGGDGVVNPPQPPPPPPPAGADAALRVSAADAAVAVVVVAKPDAAAATAADAGAAVPAGGDDWKEKLASFGDPPPPAACPADAGAAAAKLVITSRAAITDDGGKALAAADEAIEHCPSFAAAHNARGNALQKAGRLDDAADAYARALTFAHEYQAPRQNLGIIQLRRKDPGAVSTFSEILRQKPGDVVALKSRAQAYILTDQLAEALGDLEDALAKEPSDGQAWLIVGQLRDRVRKPGARDAYCKASELGVERAQARCKGTGTKK